jgi:hypothetical protein
MSSATGIPSASCVRTTGLTPAPTTPTARRTSRRSNTGPRSPPVRLDRPRQSVLPRLLRLVPPPAPPLRDRPVDPRDRPPRPRRAGPHRPRPGPERRLRRDPRALHPPPTPPTGSTERRLDQQAQQRAGRSLNSRPHCLKRLDRLRCLTSCCCVARSPLGELLTRAQASIAALPRHTDSAPRRPTRCFKRENRWLLTGRNMSASGENGWPLAGRSRWPLTRLRHSSRARSSKPARIRSPEERIGLAWVGSPARQH